MKKYLRTVQLNIASSSRLCLSSNVLQYTMTTVINGASYFKATSGISVPNCRTQYGGTPSRLPRYSLIYSSF